MYNELTIKANAADKTSIIKRLPEKRYKKAKKFIILVPQN